MTYNFYAAKTDKLKILDYIFVKQTCMYLTCILLLAKKFAHTKALSK